MLPEIAIWLNHFENHATHPRSLPPGLDASLGGSERSLIAASIATFQLGESSDGHHLLAAARAHAGEDAPLVRALGLLIAEERRHAELLREFMSAHGIPCRRSHWSDAVFRRLRHLGGLHGQASVLLTAELIGIVYYRALECATGCTQLRVLCRTMVADELVHVAFEAELLRELWAPLPVPVRTLAVLWQRMLLAGAALAVWSTHRRVLRAAGHTVRTFARACREQYAFQLGRPLPRPVCAAEPARLAVRGGPMA
jgi:hypothetical protein